ncbi:MAG: ComEC family competence protein [Afipia sp.]|nr:ComEC family competence protein [Afipia sp.]
MADGGLQQKRPGAGRAIAWPPRETAAVPAASDLGLWHSFLETTRDWTRAEAGPGRLLPWVPVAFGTGIALYFAADHEPVAAVVVPVALVFVLVAFLARRRRWFAVMVLIASFFAGFATATLKTARLAHEVLARPVTAVAVKGFVETREERERTDRFVLRVEELSVARGEAPKLTRVRLSVRKGTAPAVGSFVTLKASLRPPPRPALPGSYDFGRDMYFAGIGASGFVLGAIAATPPPHSEGLALRYARWMQQARDGIDARIRVVLSGDNRAIATALLTGRRDALSAPVNDAMFVSGLGHVLSISGYHMAVVAGVVFFAVRALLALSPALAAGFAIKKWSAAAALVAALFYLLLSGAEVATQRSFFMTAVVLLAVMADRQAITFRTLALAAMIVLALAPEALVHPSFQMSFAATLGLVAMVRISAPCLFGAPDSSTAARAALWGGREIVMLAAASLVAGLATTPYAAFHFHRLAPYGVLANLAAMPVISAVVMPAGLLGIVAMPFGFDGVFWRIMGVGIDWMIAVTQAVAAMPGAVGHIGAFGTAPLLVVTAGIVALGLLRTPLRWCGAMLIVAGSLWAASARQPDILIASDGHSVAVRGRDGALRIMRTSTDAFTVRQWLAADADPRVVTDPALHDGVSCDEAGCVVAAADGRLVALAKRPEALGDDCSHAAIVVSMFAPPGDCAALVFDQDTLRRQGATAVSRTSEGYGVTMVNPPGADRPWARAMVDAEGGMASGAGRAGLIRRPTPRPVDATPDAGDLQAEE